VQYHRSGGHVHIFCKRSIFTHYSFLQDLVEVLSFYLDEMMAPDQADAAFKMRFDANSSEIPEHDYGRDHRWY